MSKVAIVTGANKGLGLAIVKGLCKKYNGVVYLTSRDEDRGKKAVEELNKLGLKPIYHQLDITDNKSILRFYEFIKERHGNIDLLINNAGILFLKDAKESKLYQCEQTIFVNFTCLVNFTDAMLPLIKDGANIVNISSSSGHLSRIPAEELRKRFSSPDLALEELKVMIESYVESVRTGQNIEKWDDSPYVVSKVAVNAYTFILHRKLNCRGVSVNCVHPGYVRSDMTRGVGNISPEDAAEVPLRLALCPKGSGLYVWHNSTVVPWDGPDPRVYIDGRQ